ncbi:MAG: hypothetical protein PHZ19_02120 [Candidatus Thermoplasmatota archaeon]|nr:hypothetical protein [Candidatus Thermoplasmatota archaeon]
MSKNKEALRREIDLLARQDYVELPEHEMIGRRLRMVRGDRQFFYPDTEKIVQNVKRGTGDGRLYYVVYGDGEYHDKLFLCPVEDFADDVPERKQKRLSENLKEGNV